jgi:8-oxo-dGTP diphosphatase
MSNTPIVRYGAVAVVVRQERLLVIRRSQHVVAPGMYCFPGGGIEAGESEEQAVVRELQEELGCMVRPIRRIWESVSSWGVHLAWWLAEFDGEEITPNPLEVESAHWFTLDELECLPDQLESNRQFVSTLRSGSISLA